MNEVQELLIAVPKLGFAGAPRPTWENTLAVRELSAKELSAQVLKWCRTEDHDTSEQDVIEDLITLMRDNEDDGYRLCRKLEDRYGYTPDSDLVEIMNCASSIKHEAVNCAVQDWVETQGMTISFAVGDVVKVVGRPFHRLNGKVGVVRTVYTNTAKCAIHTPEQAETSSWLVLAEDLTLVSEREHNETV